MDKKATHTPQYGYEMIKWEDATKLGLLYAVRRIDPLTGEINEGSNTLTYCATEPQAKLIVRAVNSHEELLQHTKDLLGILRLANMDITAIEATIAKADGK